MVQPEGNYYDKYHSANPIVNWMMSNFFDSLRSLLSLTDHVSSCLEAGCGEGEIANFLYLHFGKECSVDAFDVSGIVVCDAGKKYPFVYFYQDSIYKMASCPQGGQL